MSSEPDAKTSAPSIAFSSFRAFIEKRQGHPLPQVIDKSLMNSMSGGSQSQLTVALRHCGLIDSKDAPTPRFKFIVDGLADAPLWTDIMREILTGSYSALGEVNLQTTTLHQLQEKFRSAYKVSGDTLEKAIRFYLKVASEAGVPQAEWFTKRAPRSPTSSRRSGGPRRVESKETAPPAPHAPQLAAGLIKMPIHLPNKPPGELIIPQDLDEDDCVMINAFLTAYAKRINKTPPTV